MSHLPDDRSEKFAYISAFCRDRINFFSDITYLTVNSPLDYVATSSQNFPQQAVKCRGCEYLRIIYGPDYDAARNLDRLRSRGLGRKRALALGEFALGVEALERFVNREPLRRVHECVFGVLALESEPVDPRL